jgi:SAM-dependent methyltransferase
MMIYSFLVANNCKSYLELGSGFGAILIFAGMGLKDSAKTFRRQQTGELYGIDTKVDRLDYSRELLKKYEIEGEIIKANALVYPWNKDVDVIFFDCGYHHNNKLLEKYSKYAKLAFFIHDVPNRFNINIPDGFTAIELKPIKSIFAVRNDLLYKTK